MKSVHASRNSSTRFKEGAVIVPGHNELPKQTFTGDIGNMLTSLQTDICKI